MKTIQDISLELQRMVVELIEQRIDAGETFAAGFWVYHYHFTELWIAEALSDPALDSILLPQIEDLPGAFGDYQALMAGLRSKIVYEIHEAIGDRCLEVYNEYLAARMPTMPPPPEDERDWDDELADEDRRWKIANEFEENEEIDNHFRPRKW